MRFLEKSFFVQKTPIKNSNQEKNLKIYVVMLDVDNRPIVCENSGKTKPKERGGGDFN